YKLVASLDSVFFARSAWIDAFGPDVTVPLHPPDAVVGRLPLTFFVVIDPRENDSRYGQDREQNCREPDLQILRHWTVWQSTSSSPFWDGLLPRFFLQIGCHPVCCHPSVLSSRGI